MLCRVAPGSALSYSFGGWGVVDSFKSIEIRPNRRVPVGYGLEDYYAAQEFNLRYEK